MAFAMVGNVVFSKHVTSKFVVRCSTFLFKNLFSCQNHAHQVRDLHEETTESCGIIVVVCSTIYHYAMGTRTLHAGPPHREQCCYGNLILLMDADVR